LELLEFEGPSLTVKYFPGVNEECPECVPTTDAVLMFMKAALAVHAPYVTDLKVVD
jgi:hypothetical protein